MKIAIVAGETSGDQLGAALINALMIEFPHARFAGIAGPRMQGAGAESWFPMEALAVRGYVEVLKNLRRLLAMRSALARRLLEERPALFIGIDAPDFNLKLEGRLKAAGIPTVHYVSPSLWAWRGERIHAVKRAVTRMLTVFPFEAPIYERAGIPVSYVGHPLADAIAPLAPEQRRADAREQLKLRPEGYYLALLPGSRQTELDYHADLYLHTAKLIHAAHPDVRFLVPLATRETRAQFESSRYRCQAEALPINVLFGHSQLALGAADAALVASGTATLEAALLGCAHVITYRMSPTTWRMMRKQALLPYVGLPNILAGRFVVPEILQDAATPANLAQALTNLRRHPRLVASMQAAFAASHQALRQDNPAKLRAALAPYLSSGRAVGELASVPANRASEGQWSRV